MRHVIITGGAGFIGSHLCEIFLKKGYAVTAIDNLVTGREENLAGFRANPDFFWLKQDVCDSWDEAKIPGIAKFGLAGILHFACPASPVDFDRIPFEILAVDSIGTLNSIQVARKHGARYLLASTSEVYGDPLVHPQTESYWGNVNPIGPRACYDETKRFAEACVSTATRLKGLNGAIVRIFNTYGPRMRIDDGRVVPELCRQAIEGKPLTLHGNGEQTRSFCFVSDLVEGVFRLFESAFHDPVNLGNPVERSVRNFAEVVQKLSCNFDSLKATGTPAAPGGPIQYLPARVDDPRKRCPDIRRARELLGWEPQVPLEEGLKLSLEYFKTLL